MRYGRAASLAEIAKAGASLLGGRLSRFEPLAGGDLSQIVSINLADGRTAVVKGGPTARAEASMLDALLATGAPAPAVLAVDSGILVIERLPGADSLDAAWSDLGKVLARLHATHGSRYGWSGDYAFGGVAIGNAWAEDWPSFWGERRLLVHCPHVEPALARRLESLVRGLSDRLPRAPAAALLHGDLWRGNVLAGGVRISGLIDPACCYGHSEADFAMLMLFDRPAPRFFESYGHLDSGFRERAPLYRLWPALVHLRLFGASYMPMVERLLGDAGV